MDPLHNNLIHFHWQDVISDKEECRERWVSAPRGGGAQERMEEKPDKKDAGNDDNRKRSHCTTSREGRGRSECQVCLWLPGDDTRQLSNPGRWVLIGKIGACDFLSDLTMGQVFDI